MLHRQTIINQMWTFLLLKAGHKYFIQEMNRILWLVWLAQWICGSLHVELLNQGICIFLCSVFFLHLITHFMWLSYSYFLNLKVVRSASSFFIFILMRPGIYASTTLTESMMLIAVADVLIDAASVLGGEATLKILYMKLVEVRNLLFSSKKLVPVFEKILLNACFGIGIEGMIFLSWILKFLEMGNPTIRFLVKLRKTLVQINLFLWISFGTMLLTFQN